MNESELGEVIAFELAQPEDDLLWQVAQGELSAQQFVSRELGDEPQRARIARLFAAPSTDTHEQTRDALLAQHFPANRARRRRWATVGAGLVAIAAAVVLTWLFVPRTEPEPSAPMPGYQAHWRGQFTGDMLGEPSPQVDDCEHYKVDGRLEVQLEPEEPIGGEPVVIAFAKRGGEERRPTLVSPSTGEDGVLTIEQSISDLGLPPGRWTLWFAIARESDAPPVAKLRPGREHAGVTWVSGTMCIEP